MRLAWVPLVAVVVWGLGSAGAARAQEPAPAPPTSEPVSATTPAPSKPILQSLKSFGSMGANLGGMLFVGGKDASKNAVPRPSLQMTFRYRFSDRWVGVGEFGFGWNAYRAKGDTVLTVTSGTLGMYRHVSQALGLDWKVGLGAGFYRWNYKFNGQSAQDSKTDLFYRGFDPGGFGGMEAEYRIAPHVTLLGTIQTHYIFSADKTAHPMRFGDNFTFLTTRVGVNYHFSPYEGILWEHKIDRTIRLQSGKAGS